MDSLFNTTSPKFWGLAFLITGTILLYHIGRRKFNRRGVGGLQHFRSYWIALLTVFMEWLIKWVAIALLAAGTFLLINW